MGAGRDILGEVKGKKPDKPPSHYPPVFPKFSLGPVRQDSIFLATTIEGGYKDIDKGDVHREAKKIADKMGPVLKKHGFSRKMQGLRVDEMVPRPHPQVEGWYAVMVEYGIYPEIDLDSLKKDLRKVV